MFRPHLDKIRLTPAEPLSHDRLRHVDILAGLIGPRHVGHSVYDTPEPTTTLAPSPTSPGR